MSSSCILDLVICIFDLIDALNLGILIGMEFQHLFKRIKRLIQMLNDSTYSYLHIIAFRPGAFFPIEKQKTVHKRMERLNVVVETYNVIDSIEFANYLTPFR